jgi:hypothetical protein
MLARYQVISGHNQIVRRIRADVKGGSVDNVLLTRYDASHT